MLGRQRQRPGDATVGSVAACAWPRAVSAACAWPRAVVGKRPRCAEPYPASCSPCCVSQLGIGTPAGLTTSSAYRPYPVVTDAACSAPLANCRAVAASAVHTLFLTSAGDIYAAGANQCETSRASSSCCSNCRGFDATRSSRPARSRRVRGTSRGR
jgi:hypothetical protein